GRHRPWRPARQTVGRAGLSSQDRYSQTGSKGENQRRRGDFSKGHFNRASVRRPCCGIRACSGRARPARGRPYRAGGGLGALSMNWSKTALIFIAAFLAVFWEAAFSGLRHLTGAQIDLLPSLVVYAALYSSFSSVAALAALGGLWLDSLSANPLGV